MMMMRPAAITKYGGLVAVYGMFAGTSASPKGELSAAAPVRIGCGHHHHHHHHQQYRFFVAPGRPSPVMGQIVPFKGFVSNSIQIGENATIGGPYNRAVYATADLSYGREIMRVPAFCCYVGDEPLRRQVFTLTKNVLERVIKDEDGTRDFLLKRVMTMMSGGRTFFFRERDVHDFMEEIPQGTRFLGTGILTERDIQKLPQILDYNRTEIEWRGRKGVCVFPEASYFNHDCDPNVELTVASDINGVFYLSGRTCRPINAGEEMYINYFPNNDLPLSRFGLVCYKRWGFTCSCAKCRGRMVASAVVISVLIVIPIFIVTQKWLTKAHEEKKRNAASML